MIENWKDIAFGSDFGGDFLDLIEQISNDELTLEMVYTHTDLKKYLDNLNLLDHKTDNNVTFASSGFGQYVHFEDAIIALSAIIVENHISGKVDLTKAYGNKIIYFKSSLGEVELIKLALKKIKSQPEKFVLFEMCLDEERDETLQVINSILIEFEKLV